MPEPVDDGACIAQIVRARHAARNEELMHFGGALFAMLVMHIHIIQREVCKARLVRHRQYAALIALARALRARDADQRRPIRVARAYVLDDVVEQDRDRMQAHSANTRGSLKTTSSLVTRTSSTRASNRELIAAISASTKSSGALAPAVTPTLRTPSNQAQSTSSAEPTSRASRAPARLATS